MGNTTRVANKPKKESAISRSTEQEEIARLAYELYEERGQIDGHDVEDWLNAEEMVRKSQENGGPVPAWDDAWDDEE